MPIPRRYRLLTMIAAPATKTRVLTWTRRLGLVSLAVLLSASLAAAATSATGGGLRTKVPKPKRSTLFPAFRGAVPVLIYHRLEKAHDGYSVSPDQFAAQMQRLHDLGFQTITLDRYVAFMRGKSVVLPERPILITFDDGYVSAWANADSVLARYNWGAAMYIPTAAVGRPGHLTWGQLRLMDASRRWQVDEHAGAGHTLVPIDASGRHAPYYADEMWANGRKETFAHYKRRVSGDIEHGAALLRRYVPGRPHDTFAVPFNDYGQFGTNDPRIEPWLVRYLKVHFAVAFVQHDHRFTRPGQRFANRIGVGSNCDANTLQARLLDGFKRFKRAAAQSSG